MSLYGVKIDGADTLESYGLCVLADISIAEATPREMRVEIPGMDGTLDCSRALTGAPTFGDREISFRLFKAATDAQIAALHGATVSLTGLCSAAQRYAGRRRFGGEPISVNDWSDIRILRPGADDPFDAPDLNAEGRGYATRFDQPYRRRKVTGRVLAVWHGGRALVRAGRDTFSTVRLIGPERPQAGDFIEKVKDGYFEKRREEVK